jgi:hypothetical protein
MFKAPKDAHEEITWLIIILIIFWIVWYFTGGPERAEKAKPFLNPPPPLDNGSEYDAVRGVKDIID